MEWRSDGRSVLLSSHILSEAEALSDRICIVRDGRMVETGTLAELQLLSRSKVTATLRLSPDALQTVVGVRELVITGNTITCTVERGALDGFMTALQPLGIMALATQPPTLEELFLSHYREQ